MPKINVTSVTTRIYKEKRPSSHPQNKPNSNPIKLFHICVKVCPERSRRISAQMNITFYLTNHYENLCHRYLCHRYSCHRYQRKFMPKVFDFGELSRVVAHSFLCLSAFVATNNPRNPWNPWFPNCLVLKYNPKNQNNSRFLHSGIENSQINRSAER